jgi:hypothetical protein
MQAANESGLQVGRWYKLRDSLVSPEKYTRIGVDHEHPTPVRQSDLAVRVAGDVPPPPEEAEVPLDAFLKRGPTRGVDRYPLTFELAHLGDEFRFGERRSVSLLLHLVQKKKERAVRGTV